jgi:hypothetical protein
MSSCWLRQRCMAVRSATHKYIWHFDKQPHELFDLVADPLERKNLASAASEPLWGPMKERLLAWRSDNLARWAGFFARAAKEFVTTLPPLPEHELDLTFTAADAATNEPRPLVRLIGLDLPTTRIVSGDALPVTLHWEVQGRLGSWQPFTHLIGLTPGARPRYNADHGPVSGRHPTSAWEPGTFVSDAFRIQPSQPLPAGRYELVVGFWDSAGAGAGHKGRAEVVAAPGDAAGLAMIDGERRVHLATIEVAPDRPSSFVMPGSQR